MAAPLDSSPLESSPLDSSPLESSPLDSSTLDLEAIHDFAAQLAVRAGALLRQAALSRAQAGYAAPADARSPVAPDLDVRDKESNVDIVTETDVRVERFILEQIRARFPRHAVLAEEAYAAGGSKTFALTDEPSWIVDPLDGTVNFLHLFPFVCVSIGFTLGRQPLVGAIYAPLLGGLDARASGGTLWSACAGRGAYQSHPSPDAACSSLAFLETHAFSALAASSPPTSSSRAACRSAPRPLRLPLQPTRPLPAQAPAGLLVASEWGKDRRGAVDGNLLRKANTFLNLAGERASRGGRGGQVQGLRSMGSAALDLAFCASGTIDVFWEGGCWEWDVCAGLAILYEAGGLATDANSPPLTSPLWDPTSGVPLPRPSLGARRFLCVRPCLVGTEAEATGNAQPETPRQAQERVVRTIWDRLHLGGLAYHREGVQYDS